MQTTLPTPQELKRELPLESADFILKSREEAIACIEGTDERLVFVVGPCSIHNRMAAYEYAARLKELACVVQKSCFLVMRVYIEKPRTTTGWKGMLYDPYIDGSNDIATGLRWTRELFLELTKREIPIATELLDPLAALYFDDLITWGFIGARTSDSQIHRQLASSCPFPVGFKNSLDGTLDNAINGILAASAPHTFFSTDENGRLCSKTSQGNPHCHLVLRGSQENPNYSPASVALALQKLGRRLLIDCAHGNCQKDPLKQQDALHAVLNQHNQNIFGLMLESNLEGGNTSPPGRPTISITDPCIDWTLTEKLILHSASIYV